jgi:hypothetical protein
MQDFDCLILAKLLNVKVVKLICTQGQEIVEDQ